MILFLRLMIWVSIIFCVVFGCLFIFFQNFLGALIAAGFLLAAADLTSTVVFCKPIIKPGPIAKSMYQELNENKQRRCNKI